MGWAEGRRWAAHPEPRISEPGPHLLANNKLSGTEVGYPGFNPMGMGAGKPPAALGTEAAPPAPSALACAPALAAGSQPGALCACCDPHPLAGGVCCACTDKKMKAKEIANGRLAMLAMAGFWMQAEYTGVGPTANLFAHLADPGHVTIFQVHDLPVFLYGPSWLPNVPLVACPSWQAHHHLK